MSEEIEEQEEEEARAEGTGLQCWLDQQRICGPDCMAFTTFPKHSPQAEINAQSSHCSLIAGVERTGRNVTILAATVSTLLKKQKQEAADKARTDQFTQTATQSPFGGNKT